MSKATPDTHNSRYNAPLNLRGSTQDLDEDPEAEYCLAVVINNATRQALYEVHIAPIPDGFDARGGNRPILPMADMSASSPARKKKTNKKPRMSSCPDLSKHEHIYTETLPDSAFKRTPIGLFLYSSTGVLIAHRRRMAVPPGYHMWRHLLPWGPATPPQRLGGMRVREGDWLPTQIASAGPTSSPPR